MSRPLKAQRGGTGPIFFQYWRMRPLPGGDLNSVGRGATRTTPTGALVGGVNNLVDAACQLTGIRPVFIASAQVRKSCQEVTRE